MKERRKAKERTLRTKLFAYLALFVVFLLVVIWVFQVFLLNIFFEQTKQDELYNAANSIAKHLDDPERLNDEINEIIVDSMIYTRVYTVDDDGTAVRVDSQQPWAGHCYLNHATNEQLQELANKAYENGGVYYFRRTVDADDIPTPQTEDLTDDKPRSKGHKEIVYVSFTESDGKMYIIMMNMIYTPLNSMVRTLNVQFLWIAAILLCGAGTLSGILAYKISSPLVKMNASAKKLAEGNYNADFSGESFKEMKELGETLNYAALELSKADKLQKDLLANISHDLRTPLTMITGYSEVIRDIPGENTPENVQVIIDESKRLTELVNDLLDLSKLQSGTVHLEHSVFDITDTVRSAMRRYSTLTRYNGMQIEFIADDNVFVRADSIRILQVVYNLINNALNYSGDSKIIRVSQTVENGNVRISVTDYGEGIAEENLPQIWDRYYKVDRVHKRAVVGTGLGLSIVKGILENHKAKYGVESELGKGSTFWFELPVCEYSDK